MKNKEVERIGRVELVSLRRRVPFFAKPKSLETLRGKKDLSSQPAFADEILYNLPKAGRTGQISAVVEMTKGRPISAQPKSQETLRG